MAKSGSYSRILSKDELKQALRRQVGHLRRSAELYDRGVFEEAERLASVAYILLSDGGGRIKPLLGQLSLRAAMSFPSTSTNSIVYVGLPLCKIEVMGETGRYVPIRDGSDVPAYEFPGHNT